MSHVQGEVHIGLLWRNSMEWDHLEDLGVDKNNIKMLLKKLGGGMVWINPAQDRVRWRPAVYEGKKFQVY